MTKEDVSIGTSDGPTGAPLGSGPVGRSEETRR
jgi:hypothetical protein